MMALSLIVLMIILFYLSLKKKIASQTGNNGTQKVEIMVQSEYLNNFSRTLEMSLINCEIILGLTWSVYCIISSGTVQMNQQHLQ